jgi:antitoxin ParD1/3/4
MYPHGAHLMQISLTRELEDYVEIKVKSGRYLDASDVIRDALRVLELQEQSESPALESAILEGVSSSHEPYGEETLDRIRANAKER